MKRFEIMENFYSSKALLKVAIGGMHTPHFSPLLDPSLLARLADVFASTAHRQMELY